MGGGNFLSRPGMFDRRSNLQRSGSFDRSRGRLNSRDNDSIRTMEHYSNGGANLGLRERVSSRDISRPNTPDQTNMRNVASYGEVKFEPDLMDQARNRAATRHSLQHNLRNPIPRSARSSRPSSNKSSLNQST